MTQYNFYFDEGGMIGNATIAITSKKLPINTNYEAHIGNYYHGKLPLASIQRHLMLFSAIFPKCKIIQHDLSQIKL